MVKPLSFKGDSKKVKKRKHRDDGDREITDHDIASKFTDYNQSASNNSAAHGQEPDGSAEQDDQIWVSADVPSDINGPVLIVLPSVSASDVTEDDQDQGSTVASETATITCLACDAYGSVFASPIENLIEGDPSTAEPHDVRQVWVATRVPGNEGFTFKGHHGKYLSCDKYGILSATSSAISPFETFVAIQSPSDHGSTGSGLFSFQTRGGDTETFLTIKSKPGGKKGPGPGSSSSQAIELRGDASSISSDTTVRVRMQARFKPKLRASKESKAKEKISRRELEAAVGRRLQDDEVKRLKRARREGNFHEEVLDVRVRGKHDKFAS